MRRLLKHLVLFSYDLAKSIGLLEWEPLRMLTEKIYFIYKKYVESPHLGSLQPYVPPGTWVVDVGANIGFFSITALDWLDGAGRIIAIEPEPRNLERLEKHVGSRNTREKVEVIAAAAADRRGDRHLIVNEKHPGDNRLGDKGLKVRAETLDQLVADRGGVTVSLIKVDVQGAEKIVLQGAEALLAKDHPALFLEVDDRALQEFGSSRYDLIQYLAIRGYVPHRLGPTGITHLTEDELEAIPSDDYIDALFVWQSDQAGRRR